MSHEHYNIERKRAAVAVYYEAKRIIKEAGKNSLDPISLASAAAGGASERRIYAWLKEDLSVEAEENKIETRGRPSILTEDQEKLLVGFAASSRSCLEPLSLKRLVQFAKSYLGVTLSNATISRLMTENGFSSQQAMSRNSRMTSEEVVDDSIDFIEEVRSYHFEPDKILAMDETGLWSNVTKPRTYHFKNWYIFFHRGLLIEKALTSSLIKRILFNRNNAVVTETGDTFRDTVSLTVRGDGVDIPPFFTLHTYKNASIASGRRCAADQTPVKGMTTERMMEYVDHVADLVEGTNLLIMDRLSSHKSEMVLNYIREWENNDGSKKFIPLLIPPKAAFLISPLDMGAISAFKANFYRFERSTIDLKKRAMVQAWDEVSNESLKNIWRNCGLVGKEALESIRERFMKEVVGIVPKEYEELMEFYEAWKNGVIEVSGATRGRGVTLDTPQQLSDGYLSGQYWTNYGLSRP
jgi:transposase